MLARRGQRDSSETAVRLALHQAASAPPEIKVKTLLVLSEHHLMFMEFDSALARAKEALRFSENHNLEKAKTEALCLTGIAYFRKLDIASALEYCEQGLARAKNASDKRLEARCLACIAGALRTHHNTPKYEQAAVDFEKALAIFENIGDTAGVVRTLLILTDIYRSEINDGSFNDKVNAYFQRAKSLLEQYRHDVLKINLLTAGGILSERNKQHEAALNQWEQAAIMSERMALGYQVQHLNLRISEYYRNKGEYQKALLVLDKAVAALPDYLHDNGARFYASIYKDMDEYEKALELMEFSLNRTDSAYSKKQADLVTEWEVRFKTKEKEQELQSHKSRNQLLLLSTLLSIAIGGIVVFGFFAQLSARKKLSVQNKIIENQAEELRHLDKVKNRFFANVSHELRTPLTLILGPISAVLNRNHLENRDLTLLLKARNSGQDLLRLINEILDLSKVESGKLKLDERPTDLYKLMRRIFSQFESYARLKGIELVFDYRGSRQLQVFTDAEKYGIVLNNLLSNALKFTPEKGRIIVRLDEHDNSLHLQVEDNGQGIHPDDLPHIFERYYQTSRPDAPAEGGTGIGLALCKEYARLFEGEIRAESTLGVGSIFHFIFPKKEVLASPEDAIAAQVSEPEDLPAELPFEANAAVAQITSSRQPALENGSKPTLLIVEDNPTLRDYIQIILEENYRVLTAENGQAALEGMRYEVKGMQGEPSAIPHTSYLIPDLIISDIMMPVMDGFQLLEKVKADERLRHIPFIMLTARAGIEDKLKALRTGVDDYLMKPFEETELLVRVANLLERYRERAAYVQLQSSMLSAEAEGVVSSRDVFVEPELTEGQAAWLEQLEAFILSELANENISVERLAQKQFLSERQLHRRLKVLTGLSPNQFIQEIRMQEARRLLENRALSSVHEVASRIGIKSLKYFSKLYLERFGKKPSDFFI